MIHATDSVEALLDEHPDLAAFLLRRGLICVQCGEPYWGTLGELIRSKGQDVNAVLEEINAQFGRPS